MNDLWLFLGCIVFLFVLWVYSGGPNNPISFAGPYITSVTAPGVTQVGYGSANDSFYGSSADSSNTSGQTFWSRWTSGAPGSRSTIGNPSQYVGVVHLYRGAIGTGNVNTEYLVISSSANAPVTITGWQLVSTRSNSRVVITQGTSSVNPYGSSALGPITLARGGLAYVTSGSSPFGVSFLETACTGYLSRNASFTPALSMRCPYPSQDLSTHYVGGQQWEFNQCANLLSTVPDCSVPNTGTTNLPASCVQFIDTNLNYSGCVANHSADSSFLGTTWRVYLGQSRPLWGSSDTIELLDSTGKVVDEYSY